MSPKVVAIIVAIGFAALILFYKRPEPHAVQGTTATLSCKSCGHKMYGPDATRLPATIWYYRSPNQRGLSIDAGQAVICRMCWDILGYTQRVEYHRQSVIESLRRIHPDDVPGWYKQAQRWLIECQRAASLPTYADYLKYLRTPARPAYPYSPNINDQLRMPSRYPRM